MADLVASLLADIAEVHDFLADQADCEIDGDGYHPNGAMQRQGDLDRVKRGINRLRWTNALLYTLLKQYVEEVGGDDNLRANGRRVLDTAERITSSPLYV